MTPTINSVLELYIDTSIYVFNSVASLLSINGCVTWRPFASGIIHLIKVIKSVAQLLFKPWELVSCKQVMEKWQNQRLRNGLSNQGLRDKRQFSFRKIARQVMIANTFTRKIDTTNSFSSTANSATSSRSSIAAAKDANGKIRKPQMTARKSQQSAELFPMSSEMKDTLASLGQLHFLPEVDRRKREELPGSEEGFKKSSNKFRDKTRKKLIHPQRFIRSIRTSMLDSMDEAKEVRTSASEDCSSTDSDSPRSPASTPSAQSNLSQDCNSVEPNGNEPKYRVHAAFKPKSYAWMEDELRSCPGLSSVGNGIKPGIVSLPGRPRSRKKDGNLGYYNPRSSEHIDVWSIALNAKRLLSARKQKTAATRETEMEVDLKKIEAEAVSSANHRPISPPANWQSVEELTTGIQQKCRKWLEIRYGPIN